MGPGDAGAGRAGARAGGIGEVRREVHQYNMQLWGELNRMRPVLLFGPAYKVAESGKGEPVVKVIKMANRQQSRITRKHFDACEEEHRPARRVAEYRADRGASVEECAAGGRR